MGKKILVDAHIHTSGISKCSCVPAQKLVELCKASGYGGIVLTNHYKKKYVDTCFKTWCRKYIDEYRLTEKLGRKIGLKVFFGVEFTLECMPLNDFTVYGLSEEFILNSPPVYDLPFNAFTDLMHSQNALIYHAHPFRKTTPVDGNLIDGVEINCHPLYKTNEKQRVTEFADKYDLRISCGSDYHGDTYKTVCGILIDQNINTTDEFVEFLRNTKRPELVVEDI